MQASKFSMLIVQIENQEGLDNFSGILEATNGIMVRTLIIQVSPDCFHDCFHGLFLATSDNLNIHQIYILLGRCLRA